MVPTAATRQYHDPVATPPDRTGPISGAARQVRRRRLSGYTPGPRPV